MMRSRGNLALGLCLLASILVMLNYLSARHYVRGDWTSTQAYSLSPKTIRVLEGLDQVVQVTAFMIPPERLEDSLYHETRELLARMAQQSSRIHVEYVDMDANPTRADLLAQRYGITPSDLREGVVVLAARGRSKSVPAAAMAEYELAGGGTPHLVAFKGEGALLEALLTVTAPRQETVCFTRGHGEAPADTYAEAGYGYIFDEVKRDGYAARVLDPPQLQQVEPAQCRVLVIGGPHLAFSDEEVAALERFLAHEGRLFVLFGPVLDRRAERYQRVGLEPLLARWGIEALDNIVVDRLAVPGEQPLMTWATRDGYAPEHPISRAMAGKLTVWPLTREVRPAATRPSGLRAVALVRSSEEGWAEQDLPSLHGVRPLQRDAGADSPGPVSVAVAAHLRGTRLVVLGTERGVLNRRIGGLAVRDYNRDFFLVALGWLTGERARVAIGPKPAEQVRLAIDERQLGKVLLICVVGLPALALLVSVAAWWRRRR